MPSLVVRRMFVTAWLFAGLAAPLLAAPGVIAPDEQAEAEDDSSDLVRVWACRFDDAQWDVNYDAWPDRWTRVYDDAHPQYVRMRIEPTDDPSIPGKRLVIRPDGAAAMAITPPIHVMPKFSYKVRMRVRVIGAEYGEARVRMAFHDDHDNFHQVEQTPPLRADGEWREIELGDFQPADSTVNRVYLHFDYDRGERGDLSAEFSVADIRLYRLPSIRIQTGSRYNVYTDPDDVTVSCSLSGILEKNPEIRFQLLDATNKTIGDGDAQRLDGKIISEARSFASDIVDGFGSDKSSYEGSIDWNPPIKEYGFYRVRVGMYRSGTDTPVGESRSITLAVVREGLESSEKGEFGWSLPEADQPLPFPVLQELLPRVGVKLVKVPVWFAPGDEDRGDELVRFAEQLGARGIETVGVLEDPTQRIADPLSTQGPPPIEGLLSADPTHWTPLIDHIITRLSLRIRWWQLGRDDDTSFVGYKRLPETLGAIRNHMFRFGQDIRVGIGWRWEYAQEWASPLTWDFEQMSGREEIDAAGLEAALDAAPPTTAQRWVIVAPPQVVLSVPEGADPDDPNDPLMRRAMIRRHQQRVRDFVEQILVAKTKGADGIFIADPFSGSAEVSAGRTGVMNTDGTPGELLLPWRTCARLLGGAQYLGAIQLPNNSHNWLFKRPDGGVVMVLWNLGSEGEDLTASTVEETLYLGEHVRVVDIWGAAEEPEVRDGRQVIKIGRMPRFVTGLNEPVARWRMLTRFEHVAVPSVFGVAQPNKLLFTNTFGQGVGCEMGVRVPPRDAEQGALSDENSSEWEVEVDQQRMSLSTGEEKEAAMRFSLINASYGEQSVRIDFKVAAEQEYVFSVWRELTVGLEDVSLEVETFTGKDGRLIVEQRMIKPTGAPTNFNCLLYAKDRRRKRAHVFQLSDTVDRRRYTYLNSEDLLGTEMKLRVEELDGGRVLIHRFKVDPKPLPDLAAADELAQSLRP